MAPWEMARSRLDATGIDGDDALGPGHPGGGNHLKTNPSASDHCHPIPGLHPAGIANRSESREHRATDQRGLVERKGIGHLHDRGRRDHSRFGERTNGQKLLQRGSVRSLHTERFRRASFRRRPPSTRARRG